MNPRGLFGLLLPLFFSPLMLGVINRVKALFAGRTGQPILQAYHDLTKLLRKDFLYSRTVSFVFRLSPVVGLTCLVVALSMMPVFSVPALVSFEGDFVLIVYALALARFFVVIGALDTGSSFEGMGAAREAFYSILAELPIFTAFAFLCITTGEISLTAIIGKLGASHAPYSVLLSLSAQFMAIMLLECSRMPFDDPNTHLELTMIHEVMVLDHGGIDLALILYSSSLKMWLFSSLAVQVAIPGQLGAGGLAYVVHGAGIFLIAMATGVVESNLARLRLRKIPYAVFGVFMFGVLAYAYWGGS